MKVPDEFKVGDDITVCPTHVSTMVTDIVTVGKTYEGYVKMFKDVNHIQLTCDNNGRRFFLNSEDDMEAVVTHRNSSSPSHNVLDAYDRAMGILG